MIQQTAVSLLLLAAALPAANECPADPPARPPEVIPFALVLLEKQYTITRADTVRIRLQDGSCVEGVRPRFDRKTKQLRLGSNTRVNIVDIVELEATAPPRRIKGGATALGTLAGGFLVMLRGDYFDRTGRGQARAMLYTGVGGLVGHAAGQRFVRNRRHVRTWIVRL